jgi:hypothetical protein
VWIDGFVLEWQRVFKKEPQHPAIKTVRVIGTVV